MKVCKVEGCGQQHHASGYCGKHKQRWLRYGDVDMVKGWQSGITKRCTVSGCGRKHYGHGYCNKHFQRWRSHGDPTTTKIGHRYETVDVAARIAAQTERHGTCLIYTGGVPKRSGHRDICHNGKMRGVHRVTWELHHGSIPPGLCVCHHCDTPSCVEIKCLFLGTATDNNRDRDTKGRHVSLKGSKNGVAKLTEWKVQQIRQRFASGETMRSLAQEFGVTPGAIQCAVRRKTWRHVQDPPKDVDDLGATST